MTTAAVLPSLVARFGEDVTLRPPQTGTYSPATGLVTGSAPVATTARAIVRNVRSSVVDGVAVLLGDLEAIFDAAALASPPVAGGSLTFGGVERRIVAVRSYRRAGSVIGFGAIVRGAA